MKTLLTRWLNRATRHTATQPNLIWDTLDVDTAIASHQNWRLRLLAHLNGQSTEDLRPEHICFDNHCGLGKWLHHPDTVRYRRHPGFRALVENHRMFHYAASNVVALRQTGKHAEAQAMLDVQFAAFSERVQQGLTDLKTLATARKAQNTPSKAEA